MSASDSENYVHGYTAEERERLVSQSRFLEPWVFQRVDFARAVRILEIGCGVGAQLKILAERFPNAHLTGVDRSASQLARARDLLKEEIAAGRVTLVLADAEGLPFEPTSFDGVFLCWVLEHVTSPQVVLREARRLLKPGGELYVTEVFNASLFLKPESPAIAKWWGLLSSYQARLGGDPYVGASLGTLLSEAGFDSVDVWPVPFVLDGRVSEKKARSVHTRYWRELFLSAKPGLEAERLAPQGLWDQVVAEFQRLEDNPRGLFYITAIQGKGS